MKNKERITDATLKKIRKRENRTQKELGEMIGLDASAISKIEHGKRKLTHAEIAIFEWNLLGRIPV